MACMRAQKARTQTGSDFPFSEHFLLLSGMGGFQKSALCREGLVAHRKLLGLLKKGLDKQVRQIERPDGEEY